MDQNSPLHFCCKILLSQVLSKEYYALQNSSEKRLVELESKCNKQSEKLAVYEKLEQELDDVIMQAAESKDGRQTLQ